MCGPKSAPLATELLTRDPVLTLSEHEHRWWVEHRSSGQRFGSPADDPEPRHTDLAYIARHAYDGRVVIHIAGIHSIGSLGATHHLTTHLADLFDDIGEHSASLAVRISYEGLAITGSELVTGPHRW